MIETIAFKLLPAPRKIIAKEAPKADALEMPKVKGDARGLRRIHCITTPATAKPAPAAKALTILTMRMFHMIPPIPEASKVKRYFMTSPKGMFMGPF